jgi:hypothetical protein
MMPRETTIDLRGCRGNHEDCCTEMARIPPFINWDSECILGRPHIRIIKVDTDIPWEYC